MSKTDRQLRILACQIDIPLTSTARQRDDHLKNCAERVSKALSRQRADLVVLPELSSMDYSRTAFDQLHQLAEEEDGPSFRTWQAVAREHNVHICYGFARRAAGRFHISIGVMDADGHAIGCYDKLHLAQYGASMEKDYFTRGAHLLTFDMHGFRLAPIICYDIRIPELTRALVVDHGVDVILHCGAYARDESFHTWHPFVTTRALENQIFLLSLNRAGRDFGKSILCLPWQDETLPPVEFHDRQEDMRHLAINRDAIQTARQRYTFLDDRLPGYDLPVLKS